MTYDGRTRVVVMAEAERGAVDLVLRDLPALQPDEALVKIRYAGICGTDLHIIGWNTWAARSYTPPFALGHEFCGEIVDIGRNERFRIGDRVTAETHLACGHCPQCRTGRGHTCENLKTFSRMDRGAFADFSVVPVKLLRHVPVGIPDMIGAIMEPIGISVRCARETGSEGKSVLVSGCGPIGLMAIAAARSLGAYKIIAADPVEERRALAIDMGATLALDPAALPIVDEIRTMTGESGVDLSIETSGVTAAISSALQATTSGGSLVIAGLPESAIPLDLTGQVVLREITIRGIYGRLLDQTWIETERALLADLKVDAVLTDVFDLDQFQSAIRRAQSGKSGKVLFKI
jgi:threonine 3-dehydrogenase